MMNQSGNEVLESALNLLLAESEQKALLPIISAESIGIVFHDNVKTFLISKIDVALRKVESYITSGLEHVGKIKAIIDVQDRDAKYTYFILDITHLTLTS